MCFREKFYLILITYVPAFKRIPFRQQQQQQQNDDSTNMHMYLG